MPKTAFDKLLSMPRITDKALGKALATVTRDERLTPVEMAQLEQVEGLPDDRFENPPNTDVWRGRAEELESLLGAKALVRAEVKMLRTLPGITVAFSPATAIKDEEAGGGWLRIYERDLKVSIKDANQKKDGTLQFSYGGFKVTVPVKKGDSREQILAKIETRLGRQQGAYSVDGGTIDPKRVSTYGISNVRNYDREGKNEAAARIEKEDQRWLREVFGTIPDAAAARERTVGERAGSLAAKVTQLLSSSSMGAAELKALDETVRMGGVTQAEVEQLVRVAVQPRARAAGKEGGEAYEALAALRGLVQQARPLLAAPFVVDQTIPGVTMEMTTKLSPESIGEDEAGEVIELARKVTVRIADDVLKQGGTLKYRFGTRSHEIKLKKGMTVKAAKEAVVDALMTQVATSARYGTKLSGVEAMVTWAH